MFKKERPTPDFSLLGFCGQSGEWTKIQLTTTVLVPFLSVAWHRSPINPGRLRARETFRGRRRECGGGGGRGSWLARHI